MKHPLLCVSRFWPQQKPNRGTRSQRKEKKTSFENANMRSCWETKPLINATLLCLRNNLVCRWHSLPSRGSKSRVTLVCSAGMSLSWRYEAKQWAGPCHLSFDSRAKYVQISKVLTLRPLSPISFPRDQRGSQIADYLWGILWPSWHPHLLSAHRYTEVQSV